MRGYGNDITLFLFGQPSSTPVSLARFIKKMSSLEELWISRQVKPVLKKQAIFHGVENQLASRDEHGHPHCAMMQRSDQ